MLVLLATELLCSLGVKCKNCLRSSPSKEISIKKDYYVGDYLPVQTEIRQRYHNQKIKFDTAWVEKSWFINSDICLLSHEEIRRGTFTIKFPFEKSIKNSFLFSLNPIIDGVECDFCKSFNDTYVKFNTSNLTDTIKFIVNEKNPQKEVGWRQELKGDTIVFLRRQ